MKKYIILVLISLIASINLQAYSYAAAGKEPTIDSREGILGAINSDNFVLAKEILERNKDNYLYLTKEFNEKFLSYGSATVKYIKEMMQKELSKNESK